MMAGAKTANLGVESRHELCLLISSGIGIEAAVNRQALLQQPGEPTWVGASSRGGDGATAGMEEITAEGVDRRLAQHHARGQSRLHTKVAKIAAGAWGQAMPAYLPGAAQFGSHRLLIFTP